MYLYDIAFNFGKEFLHGRVGFCINFDAAASTVLGRIPLMQLFQLFNPVERHC